ncbi:MAG: hypothetical protein JNN05_03205, partial [Candidatus Omnitrophica bacterium]|nr:hypothetical protein [Candidatus Omnitrophota bacterium]
MSDNQDYQAGYRGNQFHHGMDRAAYESGKSQKETEDAVARMAPGGQPVVVDGVSFTLLLVAPFIWMVYPVLGVTILAAPAVVVLICLSLNIQGLWAFLIAFILGVVSFFPGMSFEARVSQFAIYRWIRGVLRILFSFVAVSALAASKHHPRSFSDIPADAMAWGFFGAVIAYLIFQRMDLIYFRSHKEIKKFQQQLAKGERPIRPMAKRLFFGFCWFIPVMIVLSLVVGLGLRMLTDEPSQREAFTKNCGPIAGG